MKRSTKGALLSGLVYPGLGQIVQGHYARGIALAAVFTASLVELLAAASRQAAAVLATIEAHPGSELTIADIVNEAGRAAAAGPGAITKLASAAALCCWVAGIADAYLSGGGPSAGAGAPDGAP